MLTNQVIENPGTSELRKFGLVSSAIIIGLFAIVLPWLFDFSWPIWPWVMGAILIVWALVSPDTLFFIYKPWLKFGHIAGWINTRIILGVMFYLIFFPVGMLMRLLGNDPMKRKLDQAAKSYRVISEINERDRTERPY